jgi:hypothetical protein
VSIDFTEAFVAIGSENFDKTVAFYAAILGRQPDERTRDIHVAFHLPGLRLALFKPRATHTAFFLNSPDRRSGLSLVLRVPNVEQAAAELESDEIGARVDRNRVHLRDFHATILHLLGLDHERLTYRHAGRDFRVTDVYGEVVRGILA